jgi:crotonobetainyl-CoA:carnitine CoA-transferase CaiB-like acyl-CoA transferase
LQVAAVNGADSSERPRRALDGVRVLDFTTVMAGPFATRLLADLGADVVKIESAEGDQVRARPPLREGFSAYFGHLNAGKRSLVLNLKAREAVDLLKRLVDKFDIVVENFRPGVMQRLGLDYDTLAAIQPRLIYCSISGYGQTGPKAQSAAYAPVVHAASGFESVMLQYQEGQTKPATNGIFIADVLAAVYAFGAIQTALYQREKTGRGQLIDVSMLEGMLGMLVFEVQEAQFPGDFRRPLHAPLRAADGFVIIAPISPRNFEQLCVATGHPEWQTDERFRTTAARNANWKLLLAATEQWTQDKPAAEVERIMSAHGVPCSRYRTVAEVLTDPQLAARGSLSEISDGAGPFRVVNPPFRMSESAVSAANSVATLGQHGAEILRTELGLDAEQIETLREKGALG